MPDAWWQDMECRDADPTLFEEPPTPSGRKRSWTGKGWAKPALAVCGECSVRERCLDEALRTTSEHHARLVIGGLMPDEFDALRRRRVGGPR